MKQDLNECKYSYGFCSLACFTLQVAQWLIYKLALPSPVEHSCKVINVSLVWRLGHGQEKVRERETLRKKKVEK